LYEVRKTDELADPHTDDISTVECLKKVMRMLHSNGQ
jgi:hypothetical protein